VRIGADDLQAFWSVGVLQFAQNRRSLHTGRAVREPEIDEVRLPKNLLGRDGLAVISRHRKKGSRFSFPTGNRALERPAELWIRLDSHCVDACDLAGLGIALEQLRNARIGFHDAEQHIGLAWNS